MGDPADEPVNISTLRAQRERNSMLWSTRDALLDAVRRIDSGEMVATGCILCFREMDPDGVQATSYIRSQLRTDADVYGLLESVKFLIAGVKD